MREYGEADQAREHDSRAKAREARASSSILSRTVRDSAAGPVSAPPPTKRERSSSPFPTRPAAVSRLFARAPLVFLSHAGADTEAARRLKQRLEAAPEARERGLKVWFDKDDLQAGESWQGQLEKIVSRRATAFAVYVGSVRPELPDAHHTWGLAAEGPRRKECFTERRPHSPGCRYPAARRSNPTCRAPGTMG